MLRLRLRRPGLKARRPAPVVRQLVGLTAIIRWIGLVAGGVFGLVAPSRAPWLVVVVILVLLSRLVTHAPASGQTALDNTGASRGQTTTSRGPAKSPHHPSNPAPVTTPVAGRFPATSLTSGPLILINPGIVRQGSSITVTGSGFDARALVDLRVTQAGSAQSLASTFAQTDKNGAFSNTTLTVPETLPSGSFSVDAHESNGGQSARHWYRRGWGTGGQAGNSGRQAGRYDCADPAWIHPR
jgi:hypothetical protein